jgi:hypothetical protein
VLTRRVHHRTLHQFVNAFCKFKFQDAICQTNIINLPQGDVSKAASKFAVLYEVLGKDGAFLGFQGSYEFVPFGISIACPRIAISGGFPPMFVNTRVGLAANARELRTDSSNCFEFASHI